MSDEPHSAVPVMRAPSGGFGMRSSHETRNPVPTAAPGWAPPSNSKRSLWSNRTFGWVTPAG